MAYCAFFLSHVQVFRVYECGSEGPVLLFLHGGGFSALSWSLLSVRGLEFFYSHSIHNWNDLCNDTELHQGDILTFSDR